MIWRCLLIDIPLPEGVGSGGGGYVNAEEPEEAYVNAAAVSARVVARISAFYAYVVVFAVGVCC